MSIVISEIRSFNEIWFIEAWVLLFRVMIKKTILVFVIKLKLIPNRSDHSLF